MQDVHHHAVCFSTQVTPDALLIHDAHNAINKPFRCWEDVHIGLALAGWLYHQLEQKSEQLKHDAEQLIEAFQANQSGYNLVLLNAVEQLIKTAQKESAGLSGESSKLWRRDSMLLIFSQDRKSTRLNSSHVRISYAVFCLKKKKNKFHRDSS